MNSDGKKLPEFVTLLGLDLDRFRFSFVIMAAKNNRTGSLSIMSRSMSFFLSLFWF